METTGFQTQAFRINGMTCINCQNRIENTLKNTKGIKSAGVSYETGKASVEYDPSLITWNDIKAVIEKLGYQAINGDKVSHNGIALEIAGTLVIIVALYVLLRVFSTSGLAASFPIASEGMGYGMVLIIGLLTGVHCIAMCGGINLSQTLRQKSPPLVPSFLYNSGRLLSYTMVGVIVGAIGSVLTLSGRFQSAVLLIAGIFMLIMGINMLGFFPALRRFNIKMPKIFTQKVDQQKMGKGPLIVGFLNGFMPCGPLQAMQLYALSTGSPLKGGVSMFLFCLGTIPLMFALGAAGGILGGAKGQVFSRRVMYIGAVLIAAMGLTMLSNGWNLAGLNNPVNQVSQVRQQSQPPAAMRSAASVFVAEVQDGVQVIDSLLYPNRYPAIVVQQGMPVHWTINAPPTSINGCNDSMIIYEYGIEHTFKPGNNVIEFLPTKTGRFLYSCWMGMIRSTITVVGEGELAN